MILGISGEDMKARRKKLGLTLKDLEERSGVSNAYISQMETGKRGVFFSAKALQVLKALGYMVEVYNPEGQKVFAGGSVEKTHNMVIEGFSAGEGKYFLDDGIKKKYSIDDQIKMNIHYPTKIIEGVIGGKYYCDALFEDLETPPGPTEVFRHFDVRFVRYMEEASKEFLAMCQRECEEEK